MLKSLFKKIYNRLNLFSYRRYIPGTLSYKSENITLGKNVGFGGNVTLHGSAQITIGDNTMIAYGVIVNTSTHDYNFHPIFSKRIDLPIKIGRDVWIGIGAIILPGVIIEDYAVIGAGSVVTANVPKGAIAAGNPCRILYFRNPNVYNVENLSITDPSQGEIIYGTYKNKYCKTIKKSGE